jgi:Ni/Co efflux regulator RcnB
MRNPFLPASVLAAFLSVLLTAAPVHAKPGGGHGEGHGNKHEQSNDDDDGPGKGKGKGPKAKAALDDRADPRVRTDDVGKGSHMGRKDLQPGAYFNDRHREAVRTYYASHNGKACPPGLAKKNNGCMPPGQAKKWHIGEPLPTTVVYTPVPQVVLVKLPAVPPGYRYVDVAGDILLIAAGSRMVVDGINGLLR